MSQKAHINAGKTIARASLEEAIAWIDAHAAKLVPEEIDLNVAAGRVSASEIRAQTPTPPLDCAACDGYAVRAADTVGATDYNPLTLALCGPGDALHPSKPTTGLPGTPLPASSAAPIVAGAALPREADAILSPDLAQAKGTELEVFGPVPKGWGILRQGQQLQVGASLVEDGRVLLPQHIGLLASAGIQRVQVVGQPRVRLVVFPPKSDSPNSPRPKSNAAPGDANSPMLRALVTRDGGLVVESKQFEPDYADPLLPNTGRSGAPLEEALRSALAAGDADVILVAGRSGHGPDDFTVRTVARIGELAFHGVALRPGGAASIGVVHGEPVLLLPGAPLECWSAYEMLAGRLIRRIAGRPPELPFAKRRAEVGHKIVSAIGVVDLCRIRVEDGKIAPVGPVESGGIASAAGADGFVLVPAPLEGFAPGTRVEVFLFEDKLFGQS